MNQALYRVDNIEGCKIVFGPIPVSDLLPLMAEFPKGAVTDLRVASRIGADLVMGMPEDIQRLSVRNDLPISPRRVAELETARSAGIPQAVVEWLAGGERGKSSEAICRKMYPGILDGHGIDHPHDPDDFRRCRLFLKQIGASDVECMRGVSPQWTALVDRWAEIEVSFLEEEPTGSAPKTYNLMKMAMRT